MKQKIQSLALAVLTTLTVISCKKATVDPNLQPPPSVDQSSYLQLAAPGIQTTGTQLYALVSINTESGQEVVSNKKVSLDYIQGVYKTDKIGLQRGNFVLSKFIVVNNKDTAVFAAPKSNSEKALLVSTPVSVPVTIAQSGVHAASVQVLQVSSTDAAASFGYTSDDFGRNEFADLTVTLSISVGEVVYDSLPGKLIVDATSSNGTHWIREIELLAGQTQIRVPKTYESYQFSVAKWNVTAQKTLSRAELTANKQVLLSTTRQPKQLVEEQVFLENGSGLVPDSRTEYYYTAQNRLSDIKFYQRSLQISGLQLTQVYSFLYNGNQLDTIKRSGPDNTVNGYTSFTYSNGRIATARNNSYDQQTIVAFDYSLQSNSTGNITGNYVFHNGNSMQYKMTFRNGNNVQDEAMSSTGGSESGTYTYDSYINPKYQLGYPDIFLSNNSRNNQLSEQKSYAGGFPSVVPYKFEYIYNADGYPEEVYISYKGYTSQQHLYRIKKVYRYQ